MKYKGYDTWNFQTLKEMLEKSAEMYGDKPAFKFKKDGKECEKSYKDFRYDTLCLGTAIADLGFADKHVAMLGENSYDWLTVYLAMLQSNGVFVPVDKELPAEDALRVINDSDAEILFYAGAFDEFIRSNPDKFENVKYFIGIDNKEDEGNILSYKKFIEKGKTLLDGGNTCYTSITPDPTQMRVLMYTSGTTGLAKGVMLSENNIRAVIYHGLHVSTIYTVCLSLLPYNHSYESVVGILVSLHEGSTICINESLQAVLKNLNHYKPDYLFIVPAYAELFYKRIWKAIEKKGKTNLVKTMIKISNALLKVKIDLRKVLFKEIHANFGGNLKELVCGGAPIRPEIGAFFDSIGIILMNGYGITECAPLISVNDYTDNDCTTVGHMMPCLELKFENVDEDGNGEICVKGDNVMMGYYKQPELTAEVLVDGWFNTGDYGRINKNGLLMITGRKKNIIILSNGKNIFPEELENKISTIPYVSEVVVYAAKNEETGFDDALYCQVFPDAEAVEEGGITDVEESLKKDIAEVLSDLPSYKKISKVIVRDHEFVKTAARKIKRNCIDQ